MRNYREIPLLSAFVFCTVFCHIAVANANNTMELPPRIGGRVETHIEAGWQHARRLDSGGELVWHIILGKTDALGAEPIKMINPRLLQIQTAGGKFFVRDDIGRNKLLVVRQIEGAPDIGTMYRSGDITEKNVESSGVTLAHWQRDESVWAASGNKHMFSAVLRLTPILFSMRSKTIAATQHVCIERGELYMRQTPDSLTAAYRTEKTAISARKRHELTVGAEPFEWNVERWVQPLEAGDKRLYDLRGRVALIDFWGTWCTPCVKSLPAVVALSEKYSAQELVVVGIHSQMQSAEIDAFVTARALPFAIAVDSGETAQRYSVKAWPTYVLIGRDGKVAWKGNVHPTEEKILELLN